MIIKSEGVIDVFPDNNVQFFREVTSRVNQTREGERTDLGLEIFWKDGYDPNEGKGNTTGKKEFL